MRQTKIWFAMSGMLAVLGITLMLLPAGTAHTASREMSASTRQQLVEAYGHLPLSFEANQGQTDQRVRFLVRGSGYSLFLTANEAVLALKKMTGVRSQEWRILARPHWWTLLHFPT